jgi:predicted RNA-binding protein with PUA-like domain
MISDDSWLHYFDPETKKQSTKWQHIAQEKAAENNTLKL